MKPDVSRRELPQRLVLDIAGAVHGILVVAFVIHTSPSPEDVDFDKPAARINAVFTPPR